MRQFYSTHHLSKMSPTFKMNAPGLGFTSNYSPSCITCSPASFWQPTQRDGLHFKVAPQTGYVPICDGIKFSMSIIMCLWRPHQRSVVATMRLQKIIFLFGLRKRSSSQHTRKEYLALKNNLLMVRILFSRLYVYIIRINVSRIICMLLCVHCVRKHVFICTY